MDNRFGGFTPRQQHSLLSKMGYEGPTDPKMMEAFLASNPGAAAKMGKFDRSLKKKSAAKGMNTGGLADAVTPMQQPVEYEQYPTGLDPHPSTLPENQPGYAPPPGMPTLVDPVITPPGFQYPGTTFDPTGYTKVKKVDGGYAYVDPTTKQVYNYGGTPFTGQLDIANGGQYYDVKDGVATEAGKKTVTPGGPGGARTYSTPSGEQVYFNPDAEQFFTFDNKPYTGTVNMISGQSYDVTGGVNPAYTGVNAYDPTTGLPSLPEGAVVDIDAYMQGEGKVPDFMQGQIKSIIKSGNIPEDPSKYTITGGPGNWTITFDNGASFTSPNLNPASAENDAKMAAASLSGYKSAVGSVDDTLYQSQLGEYKDYQMGQAKQATADPLATLNQAKQNLADQQALLTQYTNALNNMAADDPNREQMIKLIEEQQTAVNQAQFNLNSAQTQYSVTSIPTPGEVVGTAINDPSALTTKADVAKIGEATSAQLIGTDTGQVVDETKAAVKATPSAAQATGPEAMTAAKYEADKAYGATKTALEGGLREYKYVDGINAGFQAPPPGSIVTQAAVPYYNPTTGEKVVTNTGGWTAPEGWVKGEPEGLFKEEGVSAAQGSLSEGSIMTAAQGTVSAQSLASEVNKVAEDRILKVNENVNLEVTKQQLAEAKGKNLVAIEAQIAQSDLLKDAVAQTSQVQPEELPPAALIAEDQMAQAQAMTDSGLTADANPVAAKLAKFSVDNGTLALAMTGEVNALSTVEGQLSQLMKDFDDGTPAWAAGAIRAANAVMASRGLGASSMASAAILQAAMESALPIAQQDAQTFAQMDMQNLNNRHQVALANAAAQQGLQLQNLSNEQQANLQRSAQAFALQEANLSNRQSAEIANAQIRASLQGQNLSQQQQSNIAIAARYAEAANLNLNNKQQAAMQTNANQLQTNLANLSSKSQAYITNANLAASLQGQVLNNEQQVAIQNAARFSEAANITFTAQQQAALHNSKLMQTIGLAELDANMAATLQNAATYAAMDMANLNNRQQAAAQKAKAFLEMDMANLSNEQQMEMFKAQALQQSILSDQAAENAAKQFNAASENQTNQFFESLSATVSQFNAAQTNANNQFNAGEENATERFNAQLEAARDQFNASNSLIIEQANAKWNQTISTIDTAAQNEANRDAAITANSMTLTALNEMFQKERDMMDYAFTANESAASRSLSILLADKQADLSKLQQESAEDAAKGYLLTKIASDVVFKGGEDSLFNKALDWLPF